MREFIEGAKKGSDEASDNTSGVDSSSGGDIGEERESGSKTEQANNDKLRSV